MTISKSVEFACDVCGKTYRFDEDQVDDDGHTPEGEITTVQITGPWGGEAFNHACTKTCLKRLFIALANEAACDAQP